MEWDQETDVVDVVFPGSGVHVHPCRREAAARMSGEAGALLKVWFAAASGHWLCFRYACFGTEQETLRALRLNFLFWPVCALAPNQVLLACSARASSRSPSSALLSVALSLSRGNTIHAGSLNCGLSGTRHNCPASM